MRRRDFLRRGASGLGLMALGPAGLTAGEGKGVGGMPILVFSKHLQHLGYRQMAITAREIGFDGVDLTVRPGGHVEPSNVRRDLPEAVNALRAEGLNRITISTGVLRNEHGLDRAVLETAAKAGIEQYRVGSARYNVAKPIEAQFSKWASGISELASLNQSIGILGSVQNHSRYFIGGLIWDLWMAIRETAPGSMGCQFDICHAVAEAAISWPVGFNLFLPRISALVVKDFQFFQRGDANERRFVPLGTGMVPWKQFWTMVRTSGLNVPIILHMEYGRSPEEQEHYLRQDLATLRSMLADASLSVN